MKRYMVFIGVDYESNGGMYDFSGDFNSMGEAIKLASHINYVDQ